jgi:hypothetical protein
MIRDFPLGFQPMTSVGLFRDSLPASQICKSLFKSALVFSLAQGSFRQNPMIGVQTELSELTPEGDESRDGREDEGLKAPSVQPPSTREIPSSVTTTK